MRYFLVDRITALDPGRSIRGIKNVTASEEPLEDHFPGLPLYPGALLIEACAQLAGALLEFTVNDGTTEPRRALLAQVDRARFARPVTPGDRVDLEARLEDRAGTGALVHATAAVDGATVASMVLTFVLRLVPHPRIHAQRRRLYAIWTRDLPDAPVIR